MYLPLVDHVRDISEVVCQHLQLEHERRVVEDVVAEVDVVSAGESVLSDLEQATRQLSVMDFAGMVENVETLVTTAQESLEQTMGKLNSIDFNTLNKAIEDLAKVVEPMSKLMKVFG